MIKIKIKMILLWKSVMRIMLNTSYILPSYKKLFMRTNCFLTHNLEKIFY